MPMRIHIIRRPCPRKSVTSSVMVRHNYVSRGPSVLWRRFCAVTINEKGPNIGQHRHCDELIPEPALLHCAQRFMIQHTHCCIINALCWCFHFIGGFYEPWNVSLALNASLISLSLELETCRAASGNQQRCATMATGPNCNGHFNRTGMAVVALPIAPSAGKHCNCCWWLNTSRSCQ